jgi:hypothetical protein
MHPSLHKPQASREIDNECRKQIVEAFLLLSNSEQSRMLLRQQKVVKALLIVDCYRLLYPLLSSIH